MDLVVAKQRLQERHQHFVDLRDQIQKAPEREIGDFLDRVAGVVVGLAKNQYLAHLDKLILEVEAAQARISDSTYGKCQAKGEQHYIADERLEVYPEAKYCCAHSPQPCPVIQRHKRSAKGTRKSIQTLKLKVNKAVC